MKKEETPWSKGVVLVCTKCHKSINPSLLKEEGNAGENLKNYLKKTFRDRGDSAKIRVVTSSCLDVCIADVQALAFAAVDGATETLVVHPEQDRNQIVSFLADKL